MANPFFPLFRVVLCQTARHFTAERIKQTVIETRPFGKLIRKGKDRKKTIIIKSGSMRLCYPSVSVCLFCFCSVWGELYRVYSLSFAHLLCFCVSIVNLLLWHRIKSLFSYE